MNIHLNWGHKLVFFMAVFMLFIIVLVYKISMQQVDLVDKNYYEKGIQYQQEINKFKASEGIPHEINFDKAKQELSFVSSTKGIEGTLYFYRSSDATLDRNIPFKLNEKGEFIYETSTLKSGTWKATFEWTINGQLMAAEKYFELK